MKTKVVIILLLLLVVQGFSQYKAKVITVKSFEQHLEDFDNETLFNSGKIDFYLTTIPFYVKIDVDNLTEQLWKGDKLIRVRQITEMKDGFGYRNSVNLSKGKYKFIILDGGKLFAQSEEFEVR